MQILIQKLEEINQIIESNSHNESNIGVHSGLSGLILFKLYLAKLKNIDDTDFAFSLIERSFEKINSGYNYGTFCSGLAGIGWTLNHLVQEEFIELNLDELLSELDTFLLAEMKNHFKTGYYDFLHGGIGHLMYFLSRYCHTKTLKEKYALYIKNSLDLLESLSQPQQKGLSWPSLIGINEKKLGHNLSLSHGITSIIGVLSKIYRHPEFREQCKPLLKGALAFILQFENKNNTKSLFPSVIYDDISPEYNSRLAWCYGDLGIGLQLWHAGKALSDANIKNKAIEVLKHSATRRSAQENGVIDAGICHGSFGIAQVFHRIYNETKIELFKESSEYWINDGMQKANFTNGYAGFKQWKDKNQWKSETNLLEGVAGIGLVIIEYLADFKMNWDECLMIS